MKATFENILYAIDNIRDTSDTSVSSLKNIVFKLYEKDPKFNYSEYYWVYVCGEPSNEDEDYLWIEWGTRKKSINLNVFMDGTFETWMYDLETKEYYASYGNIELLRSWLKDIPDLE